MVIPMTVEAGAQKKEKRYSYIKANLRQMLKNAFALVAEIDQAWGQHASRELTRTVQFKYNANQEAADRAAKGEVSREHALKRIAEDPENIPTYKAARLELKKFRADKFVLEAQACTLLAGYVKDFCALEFMAKTQKGQSAYYAAADLLNELSKVSLQAHKEYTRILDHMKGLADDQGADNTGYIDARVFMGTYKNREDLVAKQISSAAKKCADAIEFEVIKAYVVAVLEKSKDNPDKWIMRAQKLATNTTDGFEVAAGKVEAQPGTIAKAVASFVTSGTAELDKAVTSARREPRVGKIQKDDVQRVGVPAAMNSNPLIMAQYLSEKYMDNLKFNLKEVDPIIRGMSRGAAAAGLGGVPVGTIIGKGWGLLKDGIIDIAQELQDKRIKLAAAKLKPADGPEEAEGLVGAAVEAAHDALEKPMFDRRVEIFVHGDLNKDSIPHRQDLD